MESMTITYGAASVWAAMATGLVALVQRFGVSPILAAQGTRVPAAALVATTNAAARKADHRFRPRGRML